MTTSNAPARVPERQPEPSTASRRLEKKPRFAIKVGGMIPT